MTSTVTRPSTTVVAKPRRVTRFAVWLTRLAFAGVLLLLVGLGGVVWLVHRSSSGLPDYQKLAEYTPPTVTRLHAGDGRLLAEYAREKRIFVPVEAIPDRVKQAFIAAEDQNFYQHFGLDLRGIAGAVVDNVRRLQENRRPRGASTITQQVAKNFLVGGELSLERKLKEAILAIRIEQAYSKDRILELYLNEIFLGARSFGVAAAALNYFDKSLDELTIGEAAFIAGLPKAPSRYDPSRYQDAAIERRNYVIGRMQEDGYITADEATTARAEPLQLRQRSPEAYVVADFFTEEVRRQLVERFDELGFYEGGLSVRTTVDPKLQGLSDRALRNGLAAYDRKRGWRGATARIDPTVPDWTAQLAQIDPGFELGDWRTALVRSVEADGASFTTSDGRTGRLSMAELAWTRRAGPDGTLGPAPKQPSQVVTPGDVVLVEWLSSAPTNATPPTANPNASGAAPGRWALRQRPAVEGAIVVMDPHTGRVLAMSGGFSYRQSQFNRATQARRQPGSAFKPFVYLAGLEQGYTPATIVLDAPIVIDQGPGLPKWRPENFTDRFYGPSTLRLGLEKSRNLMTVRLAQEIGMEPVIDLARRFGIDSGLQPLLSASLGSNEVTPLTLTTAYAMLVNGGRRVEPYLVERIQDRNGRTVMRRDARNCDSCQSTASYVVVPPPSLPDTRPEVTDPRLAFQIVSMLQGVIDRGTAVAAKDLGRPLAGKTGTTNDVKDAWFVGFSPDLVASVFVGYDQPEPMGAKETGASIALPIWIELMRGALAGTPAKPFRTPAGLHLVQVDGETGVLPGPTTRIVISEAFLPGTEPSSSYTDAAEPLPWVDSGVAGNGSVPPGPTLPRTMPRPATSAAGASGLY